MAPRHKQMCGHEVCIVNSLGYPHWNCVLEQCYNCPKYPVPEEECGKDKQAPTIKFHEYANITECSLHGVLTFQAKECLQCEAIPEGMKHQGKIQTPKQLVKMDCPIGVFMEKHCILALQEYAYHQPHVNILSKFGCHEGMHQKAFQTEIGWVSMSQDYVEQLPFELNHKIQLEHTHLPCRQVQNHYQPGNWHAGTQKG
jgi:hypothetical protein